VISRFGQLHSGCPSGSGSGSVTSSAARIRPQLSAHQRIRIHNRPARGIHQQRSLPHQRKLPLPISPRDSAVDGKNQHHHLGSRQQGVQLAHGVHFGLVRALRATRSIFTLNGASMRSISLPIAPYPTSSTVFPVNSSSITGGYTRACRR
jgi:hypothetical protein